MSDAVKARLDELEAQYIADALEDWMEENPGVDPDTSEDWAAEKELVLEEFTETVRAQATPVSTPAKSSKPPTPSNPKVAPVKPTVSPKPAVPTKKPSISAKKPTIAAKKVSPKASPAKAKPKEAPKAAPKDGSSTDGVDEASVEVDAPEATSTETVHYEVVVEDDDIDGGDQKEGEANTDDKTEEVVGQSRGEPLTREAWLASFDSEGRMVTEPTFKKTVFLGGIEPNARRETWPFLLGMFAFGSTYREREIVQMERRIEYMALKERWQEQLQSHDSDMALPSEDLDDQQQFMFIQAKVNAMRYEIDEEHASLSIKAIAKDVPRTDRKGDYFCDDKPHRLQWLNDILVTYAIFHPEVGYAQGMNDVLSMILAVMDHEADAYWCFQNYLSTIQEDFMTKGMMDKLEQLVSLVKLMDPEFYAHLEKIDSADMVFCHRWLLLSFKREFSFSDAVRLFEILCSHHLELSSVEADKARTEEQRWEDSDESVQTGSAAMAAQIDGHSEYTFELFVSLAILRTYRKALMQTGDMADVFTFINGLVGAMNLNQVLIKTEEIFFEYCRMSVKAN